MPLAIYSFSISFCMVPLKSFRLILNLIFAKSILLIIISPVTSLRELGGRDALELPFTHFSTYLRLSIYYSNIIEKTCQALSDFQGKLL